MSKQKFYDFAKLMKKDSNILFENQAYHNSVYLGAYVLEAYIKIVLIHKSQNYYGHINDKDNKFLNKLSRIKSLYPEFFNDSILDENSSKYPTNLLSENYNIHYRYEVDKWIDITFCQNIQNEIEEVKRELIRLKIEGILNDNN